MAKQTFTSGQVLTATQVNSLQTNDFNQTVSTKTDDYTFLVGDRGTRVVANKASAVAFTVDDSIFSAGDTLGVHNINTGVLTLTAGAGVTINGADVLTVAQWQGGTIYFTSASSAIFFPTAKTVSAGGLAVVKAETSFSAASDVTADNVFTSTYTNYRVIVRYTTTANSIFFQLGVGGVYAATNYNYQDLNASSTTVASARSTSQTSARFAGASSGSFVSLAVMDLSGPQLAAETNYQSLCNRNNSAFTGVILEQYFGNHSTATAYDGFKFLVASGSMTGTYTIYGYAKS